MREYEVTVILNAQLKEEDRNALIARIEDWLVPDEEDKSAKLNAKHWGQRKLAYPIRKQTEGYYLFYEAQLDKNIIPDVERNMQYNESVLRYMFIRKEEA